MERFGWALINQNFWAWGAGEKIAFIAHPWARSLVGWLSERGTRERGATEVELSAS